MSRRISAKADIAFSPGGPCAVGPFLRFCGPCVSLAADEGLSPATTELDEPVALVAGMQSNVMSPRALNARGNVKYDENFTARPRATTNGGAHGA
jgi:hypothetical protein